MAQQQQQPALPTAQTNDAGGAAVAQDNHLQLVVPVTLRTKVQAVRIYAYLLSVEYRAA